jgi:hypothetical protein
MIPSEVVTNAARVYPAVPGELVPAAWHHVEQYANNRIEADHSQLKRRLRPMRGVQTDRTAQVVIAGHALVQDLRRGQYDLGVNARPRLRVAAAFTTPAERSSSACQARPVTPFIGQAPPLRLRASTFCSGVIRGIAG